MAMDAAEAERTAEVRPAIRRLTVADLKDVLARGFDDFRAVPTHLVFLIMIYPVIGFMASRVVAGYDVVPFIWPLFAGSTLIGPLFATGMYELSRRRELGMPVDRMNLFSVLKSPSLGTIVMLGFVQVAIYILWIVAARALYGAILPDSTVATVPAFLTEVFTTREGWTLIVVGSAVGSVFAATVLAISAVSFPMLLDRRIDAVTALITSVRVSLANPFVMAVWGVIVVVSLALATLPLFVGLALVMPVLGHATWHLYRKSVEA